VLLGEPGGTTEYQALEYVRTMSKPVIALMTGQSAPAEKRMGHAGAISGENGQSTTAVAKLEAFRAAGCETAALVTEIGSAVGRALEGIQT
jgi:succinyl-CoA synthetase alpha subunit